MQYTVLVPMNFTTICKDSTTCRVCTIQNDNTASDGTEYKTVASIRKVAYRDNLSFIYFNVGRDKKDINYYSEKELKHLGFKKIGKKGGGGILPIFKVKYINGKVGY